MVDDYDASDPATFALIREPFPRRRSLASGRTALVAISLALAVAAASCSRSVDRNPGTPSAPGLAEGSGPPVGFTVVGDFGKGDENEMALAGEVKAWTAQRPFDGFVTVGDNVYGNASPDFFPKAWDRPFGWVKTSGTSIVASLGNHDVQIDGGAPVMALLGMPGRYYERRIGPVDFFVLDANQPEDRGQLAWLNRALASSTAPWKVAVFHQAAFSCGLHGSTVAVQQQWVGLFQRYRVQLVLNGHDHDYQRFAPIAGVTYVVDGGGAAPLYQIDADGCPSGTPRPIAWNDDVHQFLYLSATPQQLRGDAVSVEGSILDTFLLRNQPSLAS